MTTDTPGRPDLDLPQAYVDYALSLKHLGEINRANGTGSKTGECGDRISVRLFIDSGMIQDIKFTPEGCINTRVCASALGDLALGKPVEAALDIEPEEISDCLGGLDLEQIHCAVLALDALEQAIEDYRAKSAFHRQDLFWRKVNRHKKDSLS